MFLYMVYLFAGRYLWSAQVLGVVALGALAWRAPEGWPAALAGRSAATIGAIVAGIFTVLMVPVFLMIVLRRKHRENPTHFTDPPGLACMAQAFLVVGACVNAALARAR